MPTVHPNDSVAHTYTQRDYGRRQRLQRASSVYVCVCACMLTGTTSTPPQRQRPRLHTQHGAVLVARGSCARWSWRPRGDNNNDRGQSIEPPHSEPAQTHCQSNNQCIARLTCSAYRARNTLAHCMRRHTALYSKHCAFYINSPVFATVVRRVFETPIPSPAFLARFGFPRGVLDVCDGRPLSSRRHYTTRK